MNRLLLLLFLLATTSGVGKATEKEAGDFVDHFFNAYTLKPGQADLASRGLSRVAVLPNLELHGQLYINLKATTEKDPYNFGIKHHMWEKGPFTTAFSNLMLYRNQQLEGGKVDFYGSINGITTSYTVNKNISVYFAPYWTYFHSTVDIRAGELPIHQDAVASFWLASIGSDIILSDHLYFSGHMLTPFSYKTKINTPNSASSLDGAFDPQKNSLITATLGYRFKSLAIEVVVPTGRVDIGEFMRVIENELNTFKGLPMINLVWRIR